jgi:hypothetical protein
MLFQKSREPQATRKAGGCNRHLMEIAFIFLAQPPFKDHDFRTKAPPGAKARPLGT